MLRCPGSVLLLEVQYDRQFIEIYRGISKKEFATYFFADLVGLLDVLLAVKIAGPTTADSAKDFGRHCGLRVDKSFARAMLTIQAVRRREKNPP